MIIAKSSKSTSFSKIGRWHSKTTITGGVSDTLKHKKMKPLSITQGFALEAKNLASDGEEIRANAASHNVNKTFGQAQAILKAKNRFLQFAEHKVHEQTHDEKNKEVKFEFFDRNELEQTKIMNGRLAEVFNVVQDYNNRKRCSTSLL